MSEKKKKFENWWTKNKKKVGILCGGICMGVGIGILTYLGIKNKDAILSLFKTSKTIIPQAVESITDTGAEIVEIAVPAKIIEKAPINGGEIFGVSEHIRNLGANRLPSQAKVAEALAKGVILGENQTLVDSYFKNAA